MMHHKDRRSHARGVFPTQYTSRMGTARVKEEEEADSERWKEGTWAIEGRKRPKQDLTSAKDLTMESSPRDASPSTIY